MLLFRSKNCLYKKKNRLLYCLEICYSNSLSRKLLKFWQISFQDFASDKQKIKSVLSSWTTCLAGLKKKQFLVQQTFIENKNRKKLTDVGFNRRFRAMRIFLPENDQIPRFSEDCSTDVIWIKLEIDRFFVLKLLERSFLLVAPHDVQCQMRYLLQTTTTCMVTTRPQPSWPTWQLQVDTGSACVREWVRARVCWRNQNGNCVRASVCVWVYQRMCKCVCVRATKRQWATMNAVE